MAKASSRERMAKVCSRERKASSIEKIGRRRIGESKKITVNYFVINFRGKAAKGTFRRKVSKRP
jgi:hypothetical protein